MIAPSRYMRAVDYFIRTLTFATIAVSLFASNTVALVLFSACFFLVGLWAVLYPPGILGWVQHRGLDPSDESFWWVPRLIGSVFIAMSLVIFVASFRQ